jgi:AraC-like DNA-binding protein
MDLHKASDYDIKPTIEEIKKNHIADLKTQEKYGVKFIQYWVNEDAGLVFCLMEGPDKESCIATHQEAHGNIGCNVIELKGGDYHAFLGNGKPNKFDIVENQDGSFDTARRTILMADIITLNNSPLPFKVFEDVVLNFGGRQAGYKSARMVAVFDTSSQALQCAQEITIDLRDAKKNDVEIRMGLHAGEPVTNRAGLFEETLQVTDWLCDLPENRQICVSTTVKEAAKGVLLQDPKEPLFRVVTPSDEMFIAKFMKAIEPGLCGELLTVENLSSTLATSRAQLYRKVMGLTGHSPNNFIQEMRLRKSLRLVMQKYGNVAEIAFASGFNNPSYFTKSFQKRFGSLPMQMLKSV